MVARDAGRLSEWLLEARGRLLDLVEGLPPGALLGPWLAIVNPPLWEIGHVGWFLERWVLRHAAGRPPLRGDGDSLYDSSAVAHDTRWDLPLPSLDETLAFLAAVEYGVRPGSGADTPVRADSPSIDAARTRVISHRT